MHAKQPSLPSIQSLLSDDNKLASTVTLQQRMGHRSTRSVSGELQHLSIHGPAFTETSPTPTPTPSPDSTALMINNKALSNMKPSWMQNSGHSHHPHCIISPTLPSLTYSHARSVSEVDPPTAAGTRRKTTSIPYLSPSQHQSPPFAATDSAAAAAAFNPFPPPRLRPLPMDQPRPSYQHTMDTPPPPSSAQNHIQHRRTASANTLDYMLKQTPYNGFAINKASSSRGSTDNNDKYSTNHNDQKDNLTTKTTISTSSATSRYVCAYCQKRFSRPSSLRIHTYSHSGEKPFICPDCGRRFSVQSNQRRHLRVHRLSRHTPTNSALGGIM